MGVEYYLHGGGILPGTFAVSSNNTLALAPVKLKVFVGRVIPLLDSFF